MKERKKKQVKKDTYYDIVFRTYYKEALFNVFLILIFVLLVYCLVYIKFLNKTIAFSISMLLFLFLLILVSRGFKVLLDSDKKHVECKRVTIKSTVREIRWYDWLFKPRYADKSFTENFFSEGLRVRRYKLYYDSEEGSGLIRMLMAQKKECDLSFYLYDLDYIRRNEKIKRSRKRADHELIFDVKYYRYSKIVCEIKPVKGSKYEKEDSEILSSILKLS